MPSGECPSTVQARPLVIALQEKSEELVGKVLTQLEASIPIGQQCNAVKMIVKRQVYEAFNDVIEDVMRGELG